MSVSINTYSGLKTAVADRLNRADMTSLMDDLIAEVEAEFNRVIRAQEMITKNTAFAVSGRFTALPSGFLEMVRVIANLNGGRKEVRHLGTEASAIMFDGTTGDPKYWTVTGTNLEVLPEPGGAMTMEIEYFAEITSITGGTANFLLTRYPDLYLYGTCLAGAHRMRDDKRIRQYEERYNRILTEVIKAQKRSRYGRAMVIQVA